MNNIEKIKFELHSLDTEVLYEIFYVASDEIMSNDLNDLINDVLNFINERTPSKIVKMIQYGDCKVEDDYFLIDDNGNIKSYTTEELRKYILDNYDDQIAKYLIENPNQLHEYLNI